MPSVIQSFTSLDAQLSDVGGKAVHLLRMTAEGLPVPPGFVVTTAAYRAHVDASGLTSVIEAAMGAARAEDPESLERASRAIRDAFAATVLDAGFVRELDTAYDVLTLDHDRAVAVRSSATAEDLPDLSFAGQQDTYLGVEGHDRLHDAVLACWSSLWTGRAIGYRRRAEIPHTDVALAVVVQVMVPADVSGVLFTANPLTGVRSETVIDATFGLGEALVSGLVEPDHVVADTVSAAIRVRTTGRKAKVTRQVAGGGVETVDADADGQPVDALTDLQVRALVRLGGRVQALYGTPQDIEWAITADRPRAPYLLQARAITSLYPLPPTDGPEMGAWVSFGAIQGMLSPMTPLGQDAIRMLMAGGARMFGHDVDYRRTPYIASAGDRLWVRIDAILRTRVGRIVLPVFLGHVEPSVAAGLEAYAEDPRLAPARGLHRGSLANAFALVRVMGPRVPLSLRHPDRARQQIDDIAEDYVARVRASVVAAAAVADPMTRLVARVDALRDGLARGFPTLVPAFGPMFLPGMVLLNALGPLAGEARLSSTSQEVLRGLPGNPTTEMDLALWDVARAVRADPVARGHVAAGTPEGLTAQYHAGRLPAVAQEGLAAFLAAYGMRCIGEIDIGRPRWSEDPLDVVRSLSSYVRQADDARTPDVVFGAGAAAAREAVATLAAKAGAGPGIGPVRRVRAAATRFAGGRARVLVGTRELPKFTIIRAFGLLREGLLASGADLVAAGLLERAEDIVLLTADEIEAVATGRLTSVSPLIAARREGLAREGRRTAVPRLILGDGRTIYEGLRPADVSSEDEASGRVLIGHAVSPGVAEGVVRVVLDPQVTQLRHGEILVCPGTDPAWTPLFLSAAALITEVGGMMTHGSVVAREYGIPAVVGVHEATTRLVTGERIRVDGSAGVITRLPGGAGVAGD